jgi:ABC-type multidrug transport system ATPase subunit
VLGVDLDMATEAERRALERRWGVLFPQGALFSSLTVRENIQFPMRENLHISQRLMDEMALAKLEMVGLTREDANKYPAELSGGMTKRVALARALALDPEIVFLDEPTSGLDPLGRLLVRSLIEEQRARGATVFLNSHLLGEVEATCDRVVFVKQGRVIHELSLGAQPAHVEFELRIDPADGVTLEGLAAAFGGSPTLQDGVVRLAIAEERTVPDVARWLVGRGVAVYELRSRRKSLEEWFIEVMGEDQRPG